MITKTVPHKIILYSYHQRVIDCCFIESNIDNYFMKENMYVYAKLTNKNCSRSCEICNLILPLACLYEILTVFKIMSTDNKTKPVDIKPASCGRKDNK